MKNTAKKPKKKESLFYKTIQRRFIKFSQFLLDLKSAGLLKLISIFLFVITIASVIVYAIEHISNASMYSNLFDSFWWSIVTIATVGYGDKVPSSIYGRIFAIGLIFSGIILTSLISGTVASMFVDKKIKESKGLHEIKLKDHIMVCGWNTNAEKILYGFSKNYNSHKLKIVLVNSNDAEKFEEIKSRFQGLNINFIHGDFTNEIVLKRASIELARSVLFIPDTSGENSLSNSDERTILGTLAVKSINDSIPIAAEILKSENEIHLKRTGIQDIIISGEFTGFLLSASGFDSAIPRAVKSFLNYDSKSFIKEINFPPNLIGKHFIEASAFFLHTGCGVLIGILSKEKQVTMEDILSDDTSAIDAFILRKFKEAEIDIMTEIEQDAEIRINPGIDYIIKETDIAFIIG